MLVTIEDLIIGDEILIGGPSQGLMYYKVLRMPKLRKKPTKYSGVINYTSVLCSTKKESISHTYHMWDNKTQTYSIPATYVREEYVCSSEDHNHSRYVNLNKKSIWLVKGEPR
jgi:hypothetical protein